MQAAFVTKGPIAQHNLTDGEYKNIVVISAIRWEIEP